MAALAGALVAGIASVTLPAVDPRAGWRWVRRAATSPAPVGRSARGALLIAVGAAIVVEPALLGRAAVAVGGVLLVVVGIAQFSAMRAPSGEAAPATAPAGRAGPRPWAPAVAVVLVVALTGLAMALVLPGPRAVAVPIAGEPGGCNGLRAMCERRLDQVVFAATHNSYAAAEEPGWLFANQRFGIARQAVHRWWYRHAQAAGLVGPGVTSGLNMHQARHAFAMELRRVAGIDAASHALGHADLSTTLGIYGHRDDSDLERAMDAYAAWLERQELIVPPEGER
jgi:hypothetical protein